MDRKLLPLLLLLLAANTPVLAQDPQAVQRHRQRMLELFHRLDHDNDGRLYLQEAGLHPSMRNLDRDGDGVLLLRDITPPGAPFIGERLLQAVRRSDRNGDGLLSKAESKVLPGLSHRFEHFDRNRDGYVSVQELMAMRQSLSPRRPR